MTTPLLAGIAGRARAGKNTFVNLSRERLASRGLTTSSFAFATELKLELDPILRAELGISAFTQDPKEKLIIRPRLVEHGAGQRAKTNGRYWIDKLAPQVERALKVYDVVFVEDVRYANEAQWVHSLVGTVIYVERKLEDGTVVQPANEEEATNDPKARAASDHVVSWPTLPLDQLKPHVADVWAAIDSS